MPFEISPQFNGLRVWKDHDTHARCQTCGLEINKWSTDFECEHRPSNSLDLTISADGFFVGSKQFKRIYDHENLIGLNFYSLANGYYVVVPSRSVRYDLESYRMVFREYCITCDRYSVQLGSPDPIKLQKGESPILKNEFVCSELEFGDPMLRTVHLLCGDQVYTSLVENKVRKLVIKKVWT